MPENITIAAFVLGAVMLLIAIIGGRFKIFGAEVSAIAGPTGRTFAGVVGAIFIVIGLYSSLPSKAEATSFKLKTLTCIKPQDKDGVDEIYLKFGNEKFEIDEKFIKGKTFEVNKIVKSGVIISLHEQDTDLIINQNDDFLGEATVQGRGGKLQFKGHLHRDYHYTLSYEPES